MDYGIYRVLQDRGPLARQLIHVHTVMCHPRQIKLIIVISTDSRHHLHVHVLYIIHCVFNLGVLAGYLAGYCIVLGIIKQNLRVGTLQHTNYTCTCKPTTMYMYIMVIQVCDIYIV